MMNSPLTQAQVDALNAAIVQTGLRVRCYCVPVNDLAEILELELHDGNLGFSEEQKLYMLCDHYVREKYPGFEICAGDDDKIHVFRELDSRNESILIADIQAWAEQQS